MDKYSVLMTVYAKEKPEYLQLSIQSMLDQTSKPDEFVLVKDGPLSKDLESIIDLFCTKEPSLFHMVSLPQNVGLGSALAVGIQECHNELVARMDSDDYSAPERCELELELFSQDPSIDMVGSNVYEFLGDTTNITACRIMPETQEQIYHFAKRRCPLVHPTIMYKKSVVLRCGNYQSIQCEDYDLLVRMLKNGAKGINIQKPLFFVRVDRDVYKRRGGLRYMKTLVEFRKNMYQSGFSSFIDFLISAGGQVTVCLMPNAVRDYFYKTFLRDRV